MQRIVPRPVTVEATGEVYALQPGTAVVAPAGSPEGARVAQALAGLLAGAAGTDVPVVQEAGNVVLTLGGDHGAEGYQLDVRAEGVRLVASEPAGLFRGVQTIRQLLGPTAEGADGPAASLPGGRVVDRPRFANRGAMLDVARHFFGVEDVERYLDLLALYKINHLHLHLTDDQGWRIEIESWPELTAQGSRTAVDGDPGGYYTKADYARIVRYAAERFITVVPEIDMPGHTNAALSSYGELTCDGVTPPPYTGIEVGFSSLCIDKDVTYRFVDEVLGEVAAMTPGPYLHIGGDEAKSTPHEQYVRFIERVRDIVAAHGKTMVGWEEIAAAKVGPDAVAEYWNTAEGSDIARRAVEQGVQVILAPARHTYFDLKYDEGTALGLEWAGHVELRDAYDWDPASVVPGVTEANVLGVEACLWSETLRSFADVSYMLLPRLAAFAEVAWTPQERRGWDDFAGRVAGEAARWSASGLHFHRSPGVAWPS